MEYIIFVCCVLGVGFSSYNIGMKQGGEKMIDMLELIGIITVDENDDVWPNKSYNPKHRSKK
jgi:hypothetical protein